MKKQRKGIYTSEEELNKLKKLNEERLKKEKDEQIAKLKRFKGLCGRIF